MKNLEYIILLFLVISLSCHAQETTKCNIITALLDINELNTHLKLSSKSTGYIRILDQSKMFSNCKCNYGRFSVGIIEDIPLDFNTGRYIDLAILRASKNGDFIDFEIFFALSGQNDNQPNLFTGEIIFRIKTGEIEIEKASIGNIQ